jgi:hypothetical protein
LRRRGAIGPVTSPAMLQHQSKWAWRVQGGARAPLRAGPAPRGRACALRATSFQQGDVVLARPREGQEMYLEVLRAAQGEGVYALAAWKGRVLSVQPRGEDAVELVAVGARWDGPRRCAGPPSWRGRRRWLWWWPHRPPPPLPLLSPPPARRPAPRPLGPAPPPLPRLGARPGQAAAAARSPPPAAAHPRGGPAIGGGLAGTAGGAGAGRPLALVRRHRCGFLGLYRVVYISKTLTLIPLPWLRRHRCVPVPVLPPLSLSRPPCQGPPLPPWTATSRLLAPPTRPPHRTPPHPVAHPSSSSAPPRCHPGALLSSSTRTTSY